MSENKPEDIRADYLSQGRNLDDCWLNTIFFNDKFMAGWREWKNLVFMSNATAGEGGEVAEIYAEYLLVKLLAHIGSLSNKTKKFYGGGSNRKTIPTLDDLLEEFVDIDIYKILFVTLAGKSIYDYIEVFNKKMAKLVKRMEEA